MESPVVTCLPHQTTIKRNVSNSKQYKKNQMKNLNDFEDTYCRRYHHNYYGEFDDGHFGYQVFKKLCGFYL